MCKKHNFTLMDLKIIFRQHFAVGDIFSQEKGTLQWHKIEFEYRKRTCEVHIPQDIQKQMADSSKQQQKEIGTAGI